MMSNKLMTQMAQRFNVPEQEMLKTLKETAFKLESGQVSDAQMTALLIVANQYGLNPWTEEIYAFPHKGSIVPIVGVDGWARIINDHPMFDGMDFEQDGESCTCRIYRKDRSHPVQVTEYMGECNKQTQPWKSHPKRMLRHKALIQCARMAFSYSGIYDEDEAERIIEKDVTPANPSEPVFYSDADFEKNFGKWSDVIQSGKKTAQEIIAMIESKAPLTEKQKAEILSVKAPIEGEIV